MAVNHNRRTPGPMFIARPDDRMTLCRHKLRLQTDPVELVHQPVCTLGQLFFVLVISRDTRKPQERIILLEIIVAHGARVNPRSYERPILTSGMGNVVGRAHRLPRANDSASGALALQQPATSPIHMLSTRD